MEKNKLKRLPVIRDGRVVGIVTRANLLQAVASLARQIPIPQPMTITFATASSMRSARTIGVPVASASSSATASLHLSGIITDERSRQAAIVCAETIAGVKKVHDHLCWVDPMSGLYFIAPEDEELAKAS